MSDGVRSFLLSRRKEHQVKVRLTDSDIASGNIKRSTERINEQDGGLAKHSTGCREGINWVGSRIKSDVNLNVYFGLKMYLSVNFC